MANQNIATLVKVLEKQGEFYQTILDLALEKQPLIVKGDLAHIEEITRKEQLLVVQLGKLEEARAQVHQAVAQDLGIPVAECTFAEILAAVDAETAQSVKAVGERLDSILKELQAVNQSNNELIEQSLNYIDFMINLISTHGEAPEYPDKDGRPAGTGSAKLFDKMV